MLDVEDLVPRLLAATPSAQAAWDDLLETWGDEEPAFYIEMAVFAQHAVALCEQGSRAELASLFDTIEQLLAADLTPAAFDVLTIGLIEDIQNIASHEQVPVDSSQFIEFLGPRTHGEWLRIHARWGNEGRLTLARAYDRTSPCPGVPG